MKIHLNSDSSIEGSEALARSVNATLHDALGRSGDRLTRVEVHLNDQHIESPEGTRCLVEARPAGLDPIVVTGIGDTIERACHDAAQKIQSRLDSAFGRIDSRDATVRHHG